MKRTFTTVMPDKIGAFLAASDIFAGLGLNITRVSYNKAVDAHTLFIEAEGEDASLERAEAELGKIGYLPNASGRSSVIVVEFQLRDVPGTVEPVLKLISEFGFNISYISSQATGADYQYFRMGLFVESGDDMARFLRQASQLCSVRIIDYDPSSIALDNTVFYMSFANNIADKVGMSETDKQRLIIDSNLIMELLTRRNSPPYKTFDYIGKFAEQLIEYRADAYRPRISRHPIGRGLEAVLIEPPCGSNLCVISGSDGILCVDSGFPCYKEESLSCLRGLFPDFDSVHKILLITHADVDHCGLADCFDDVYMSRKCFDNFSRENSGEDNLRELNAVHAPYVRISKLLAGYRPLPMDNMRVIGGSSSPISGLTEHIGRISFNSLDFEVYEASGGHVRGEVIYIERSLRILFTGDIFVNIQGFTPQQAAFNRLAPYLMTSVDTDPKLAARERKDIFRLLGEGEWQLFGGHGAMMPVKAEPQS